MNQITEITDEIDLREFFRVISKQLILIFSIITIGASFSIYSYVNSEKKYKVTSLFQVFPISPSSGAGISMGPDFGTSSSQPDIELIDNLYKSRTNAIRIIEDMALNTKIVNSNNINITNLSINDFNNKTLLNLFIKLKEESFLLLDKDKKLILEHRYDDLYQSQNLSIKISKPSKIEDGYIELIHRDPSSMYKSFIRNLSLNFIESKKFYSSGGLVGVSYITSDIELGKDLVDYANQLYIDRTIETEKQKARQAIRFIDSQISSLEQALETKKESLNIFRLENQSLNVDLEIKSILETLTKIEEGIISVEIDISEASKKYTSDNPYLINLKSRKAILDKQKSDIEKEIKGLPILEQKYIDLYRDTEITRDYYSELVDRKLAYSILEASTIGNIQIVDKAYLDSKVSPRISSVFIMTFLSALFSIVLATIRGFFFLPITNPAEINRVASVPIIGLLPSLNDDSQERFNRAVESLLINIKTIQANKGEDKKLILISSATESCGKSLVSRSVAINLAKLGSKVLLIDNDLLKGKQHKFFKTQTIRESDFFQLDSNNIEKFKMGNIDENLYFIPRIKNLNNSFNFLYRKSYFEKLESLKNQFDFIIVDTPPILGLSESLLLMQYCEINLLMVRHKQSHIKHLKQTLFSIENTDIEIDGFVYNDQVKESIFGYYGDYKYQYYADKYTYVYDKDERDEN